MKAVMFYESNDTPIEKMMAVFPRHKALLDAFHAQGLYETRPIPPRRLGRQNRY
jgi:uncharacterized protein YciI